MKMLVGATEQLREGVSLEAPSVPELIEQLIDDNVELEIKAEFLRALHDKGETPEEISAFVEALLPMANDPGFKSSVEGKPLLDVCGPGGGGLSILNVSTGIVFILAACGVPVVKHGNKGLTKKSGSSDVLAALNINVSMDPSSAQKVLEEVGACFLFAPAFHPAFKHLAPVRAQLGQEKRRSIFNLLGPLLNPACPDAQLIGVFRKDQLGLYDSALHQLGRKRHVIVRGLAGDQPIGEVSVMGNNTWKANLPEDTPIPETWKVGRIIGDLDELRIASPKESAARIESVLKGHDKKTARALLLANAAAAICTQGTTSDYNTALSMATEAVDEGHAIAKLNTWRKLSQNE